MTIQSPGLLAIAGVAFVLFGIGLVFCVMNLIRGNREDVLASAPIVHEQGLTLASAGETLVVIEVPRTASDFRSFQIQLTDGASGQSVTMSYSLATAQGAVYGVSTMQVPFGRFKANAGTYLMRIAGLQPGDDYSRYRLILSRPYLGRMALQIIGIALCGVGMLGCVIWSAWLAGLMKQG
jgi:hypothetical protein